MIQLTYSKVLELLRGICVSPNRDSYELKAKTTIPELKPQDCLSCCQWRPGTKYIKTTDTFS